MQSLGLKVEPNESLSGNGGPDFRCEAGADHFYVEVTCITIANAEKKTQIGVEPNPEATPFNVMGMTEAIFAKCMDKAPQCANLDGPALVAVGTFHPNAAMFAFGKTLVGCSLTGKTKIAWDINIKTGHQVGGIYQITELDAAAFLCPDKSQEVGYARSSISGVLLCSLGISPIKCLGVLHPNPGRPFDPALLPDIEFGEVQIDRTSKSLRVHWPRGYE